MSTSPDNLGDGSDGRASLDGERLLKQSADELERRLRDGETIRTEEFLARHQSLVDDPELAMDLIYVEFATRRDLGQPPCHEELIARFPQWRTQLERQFQLDELLDGDLSLAVDLGDASSLDAPPKEGMSSGRFEVQQIVARGGLGQVRRAIDRELNREVAVKQLQPQLAENRVLRERFLREAEITGTLEHPGIVPVYGLGWDGRGHPFYAMRLVRGQTLQQAAREFHRNVADARRFQGVEFQKLLRCFLQVCETVAYAHSRGVVHRDLKPSNVLLGPFGETLVVDWGLARTMSGGKIDGTDTTINVSSDQVADGVPGPARPEQIANWSSQLTRAAGEVLGTPAFMSPEQAGGATQSAGPATDVYGLGATLFVVLTGEAPFVSSEVDETLRRVRAGLFQRPRQSLRSVPRALEAICLKAMALRPEDRYASPRDLAGDLERWLADDPVEAMREPWWARMARWARRHRSRVVAGLIAVVLVALVAVAAAFRINQERLRADHERIEANRRNARLAFDRGYGLLESHEYGAGMLWFARALEHAPRQDTALRRVILTNLDAARHHLLRRRGAFPSEDALATTSFGADGKWLVTSDVESNIKIWDVDHESTLAEFNLAPYRIRSARACQDVAYLATLRGPRLAIQVIKRDAPGEIHRTVELGSLGEVQAADFNADGSVFAAALRDPTTAHVWSTQDGQVLAELSHPRSVTQLAFRPASAELATVSSDGRVRLWNVGSPRVVQEFEQELGVIQQIEFSPDGNRMFTCANDGSVACWNLTTGKRMFELSRHLGLVTALACDSNGKFLAASWDNGIVRVWNLETRRLTGEQLHIGRHTLHLVFRPGSEQLLIATKRHMAELWELPAASRLGIKLDQPQIEAAAFSPDGTAALTGSRGGFARLRHSDTGEPFGEVLQHQRSVRQVSFRPDGKVVLTAGVDGTCRLWNAADGQPVGEVLGHRPVPDSRVSVDAATFSPDNQWVATGDSMGMIRLWDATSGELVRTIDDADGLTTSLRFSPAANQIVGTFGPPANCVKMWDVSSGRLLWTAKHGGPVRMAEFNANGSLVISASNDESARFWQSSDGQSVGPALVHGGEVFVAAFSPDGRQAVTGGYDSTVRFWEVPSGRPVGEPMRHDGVVLAVTYCRDGAQLLSGGTDRTARFWDTQTSLPLGPPLRHDDVVYSISVRPAGDLALTGRLWRLPGPLPDEPVLVDLWTRLITERSFVSGDHIDWLEAKPLESLAATFRRRAGVPWHEWNHGTPSAASLRSAATKMIVTRRASEGALLDGLAAARRGG